VTAETAAIALTLIGALSPAVFFAAVSLPTLAGRPLGEVATAALSKLCFGSGLASLLGAWIAVELSPTPRVLVEVGEWFRCGTYAFHLSLLADRLSLPFAAFSLALCGVVASFSHRYLHREAGYNRYFAMLALFASGITLVILGGSIELVFAGWELVGVSSALLVAFFHDRPLPVRNGLRTLVVYRTTDVGLVVAAVLLHHALGTGEFGAFVGDEACRSGGSRSRPEPRLRWASCGACRRWGSAPRSRSPAGSLARWRGRRPRARSSMVRCRCTRAPS
jgi:NAD(P)H-quinone oxidoreductase subunit 5